jgi:hypothetical protein
VRVHWNPSTLVVEEANLEMQVGKGSEQVGTSQFTDLLTADDGVADSYPLFAHMNVVRLHFPPVQVFPVQGWSLGLLKGRWPAFPPARHPLVPGPHH